MHILNIVNDDDDDDDEEEEEEVDDDYDNDDDAGEQHFLSDGRGSIQYLGNRRYTGSGKERQERPRGTDGELGMNSSSDLHSGKETNGSRYGSGQQRVRPSRTFEAPMRSKVAMPPVARRKSDAVEAYHRRQQSPTQNGTFFSRYYYARSNAWPGRPGDSDRQGGKRQGSSSNKRSKLVGWFNNGSLKLSTIVWPGGSIVGPVARGPRILRVVTMAVDPFVMEQPDMGACPTSTPCLRISPAVDESGSKVRGRSAKGTGGIGLHDEEASRSVENDTRRNLLENIFEDFESRGEDLKADLESR